MGNRVTAAVLLAASCLSAAALAGTPAVLELPGADGTGTVDVQAFSWGVHKSSSNMGTARTAIPADATAATATDAAPQPGTKTEISFTVDPAAGPAAAALATDCVKGKHFDKVVLTVQGERRELGDVTFTCTGRMAAGKPRELKGHVTLIK
jgi:hypothetical protein